MTDEWMELELEISGFEKIDDFGIVPFAKASDEFVRLERWLIDFL